MGKYYFPAIFDPGTDGEQGFTITFPDLPGCITEGSNMDEAVYMAKDVLAGFLYGMEEDGETIPTPSNPNSIDLPQGAFISIVEVRTDYIRDEIENKAVKKTLTIPKWLNDAAENENINFSQLLQFAIKERLGIISKEQ
ncbi:type II toxin-antitoxin system HicB family antitoxin [Lysinibacillus capsici]|uniref:type II toxin-antitoxin system HicB family antitoxin n=1 Tax=Lysinibacillus capsici TaxID=2115968 RepID=UPI002730F50D|nr:type II toxin-antitoxin system HicB family antitoxin [Lysinibacillus capsici]MDP1394750.1 type II toxin-antitoxin system HicB family antitoxin [Lysinibacillus capsici]MDP1415189.1 type II toxin-antitoxin system HicB family antitoxin [Lysinibacillus capsici]MDP1431113.1 type II toxin-antitoxin system HicB family antitoxin [Lysinibacillus capsici]